jgi:hypothetical protein
MKGRVAAAPPCLPHWEVVREAPPEFGRGKKKMTDAVDLFFDSGTQYYIAGRFGAFAALNPVAGNLMHHAIEHLLKGGLAKTKSLDELAKKPFGHNLPGIWDAFKAQANDPNLARFDSVISTLHQFEELRYPNSVMVKGMQCTFNITKAGVAMTTGATATVPLPPQYNLVLEEIDELVEAIFAAASRNPKAYVGRAFKPEAQDYIVKDNAVRAIVEAVPRAKAAPANPAPPSRTFRLGEIVKSAKGRLLINTIDANMNDPTGWGPGRGWELLPDGLARHYRGGQV